MVILGYFHVKIEVNDLATLIGAVATIIGISMNFYHRYQKGDITAIGIRLPEDNQG